MSAAREKLARIKAAADKATEGPWKMWGMAVLTARNGDEALDSETIAHTADPDRGLRTFNGEFICAARTDVPAMAELLTSILDYIDNVEQMDTQIPNDVRPDPIVIGLQIAATDLRHRFDLFAAGQPVVIPPVPS